MPRFTGASSNHAGVTSLGLNCLSLMRNFPRRSPIRTRKSLMLKSHTSCMRISKDAPTGNLRWRILLITGGATSSARDSAASFLRLSFSINAPNKWLGSYSGECRSLLFILPFTMCYINSNHFEQSSFCHFDVSQSCVSLLASSP